MKYLLIKNNVPRGTIAYRWHGCVVKYTNNISYHYAVEILCDPVIDIPSLIGAGEVFFMGPVRIIYIRPEHIIDITSVYNKILHLKNNIVGSSIYGIQRIIDQFKAGIYPTKSDFHYMNKLYKTQIKYNYKLKYFT